VASGQSNDIPSSVLPATGHRSLITGPCPPENPLLRPNPGPGGAKQASGGGFSQLTFSVDGGEYFPSGFPT